MRSFPFFFVSSAVDFPNLQALQGLALASPRAMGLARGAIAADLRKRRLSRERA
jgi:hypothetical protein